MFVQHMLAVLRPGGMVVHRHAPRRALPRRGRAGDPQGLHRGRPARGRHRPGAEPLLRHRHPGLHPGAAGQGGKAGRAPGQGALHQRRRRVPRGPGAELPGARAHREDRQRLPSAFADIPGFAAVVAHDELAENDYNLNIRRYADNAPPPEPHDVRAHLLGGVPKAEVDGQGRAVRGPRLRPDAPAGGAGRRATSTSGPS